MKKGFTLIELLAVIVILAIIAVIAVPIVLNIIDESKENAILRSGEFYLDAVDYAIANRVMNHGQIADNAYPIMKNGNVCLEVYNEQTGVCSDNDSNLENNELIVDVNGEKPSSGTIIIKNGQIVNELSESETKTKLVMGGKTLIRNEKNEFKIEKEDNKEQEDDKDVFVKGKLSSVCNPLSNQLYTTDPLAPGYTYECDVDPNKEGYEHTFFVLNSDTSSVNLIMDRNICSNGEEATTSECIVEYDSTNSGANGPVTAIEYLNQATSKWENVDDLDITYNDEGNTFTGFKITGKARLPKKSEVSNYSAANAYLYYYLSCEDYTEQGGPYLCASPDLPSIMAVYGYWTLSTNGSSGSWYVGHEAWSGGIVYYSTYSWNIGVRPVINLKI